MQACESSIKKQKLSSPMPLYKKEKKRSQVAVKPVIQQADPNTNKFVHQQN
jgi:hypothetical protein